MRLALIASGFTDYSLELAGALAQRGPVLVLADADALARERGDAPPPPGVTVRRFRQTDRLRRWGSAAGAATALAAWRPQAVLAHEHAHPHLTALFRLARRTAPLGLIVHDPEPHPGRDAAFAAARRAEITAQRALADRLFAHGAQGAATLARLTGREVPTIRHGPILRPTPPPAPPPGRRRVLMFGRMEAYKGLDTLLAAVRRLHDEGVGVTLDLRGEGPELTRLEGAFRALPACEVRPGVASRAELLDALAACDLVVAPYLHASASGVAAAALANGRGLVASAVGGLGEMVQPGLSGALVPPGEPEALADALAAALPHAARFGGGALALAEGAFSWAPTADRVLDALTPAARAAA